MPTTRRLRRFFLSQPITRSGGIVDLSGPETRHLKNVMRLKKGDRCLLADGTGREAEARVLQFAPGPSARLEILKETKGAAAGGGPALTLRIFQGMLQKRKMDYLVEKAQELGIREIHPLRTVRSEVSLSQESWSHVLARWEKIARNALKQSGSLMLLKVFQPLSFSEAIRTLPDSADAAFFHPGSKGLVFREWLDQIEISPKTAEEAEPLNLFFGPEGGFSSEEIRQVWERKNSSACSFHIVRLGESVLKSDTAFFGVVSSLRFLIP